ncbi:tetratricopeptide repeat protein [Aestuariispira insulae]|uniref:Flp pilus assembly protein TadD n=1 Tax=Aestuariispira insulae TaxID=1461337 RepID=A0A3D9HMX0_9PROT|nr:tetratricopeptide repeat protein [Aestuariispira insulae]RED50857.1 Flp pilus assembly protein TadD [Aestuariispira insulae]
MKNIFSVFYAKRLSALCLTLVLVACNTAPEREIESDAVSETKLMELAQKAESRNDIDAAIAFYRQANLGFPNAIGPVEALSRNYSLTGAHRNAAISYRRLAELVSPDRVSQTRIQEGRAWLKARNPTNAALAFQAAIDSDINAVPAMLGLGVAQELTGNNDRARISYQRALKIEPDNPATQNNLALSYIIGGQANEAVTRLEKLVETHPDKASYRQNLGMALIMDGKEARARTELSQISQGELLENNLVAFKRLPEMSPAQRAQFIFNSQLLGSK